MYPYIVSEGLELSCRTCHLTSLFIHIKRAAHPVDTVDSMGGKWRLLSLCRCYSREEVWSGSRKHRDQEGSYLCGIAPLRCNFPPTAKFVLNNTRWDDRVSTFPTSFSTFTRQAGGGGTRRGYQPRPEATRRTRRKCKCVQALRRKAPGVDGLVHFV